MTKKESPDNAIPNALIRLTDLSTARARRDLDASIVHAVMDIIQPRRVSIARLVSTPHGERWWVSARIRQGDIAALSDNGKDIDANSGHPSSFPSRIEALMSMEPITHANLIAESGAGVLTTLEIVSESHGPAVLEIETSAEPVTQDQRLITAILRSYRQMDSLIEHPQRDPGTGLLNGLALANGFDKQGLFKAGASFFLNDKDVPMSGFITDGDMDRRNPPQQPIFWIGIIDIDRFNEVNSFCGHEAGDQVLMTMTRILRNTFRHRDRFFRLGADEIAAVIRCPSQADANAAFERFRAQLNRFYFPDVGFVTTSVGLTQIRTIDTAMSAITRAHKAVEEAKENGRDKVACLDQSLQEWL